MATIVNDIQQINVFNVDGSYVTHSVEDILSTKTFEATNFLGAVDTAILYVYCSVDLAAGDPTITFGKPGFEAALPAPANIFAKTDFLTPRPGTEESRSYRYDVTATVDEPGLYNVSGSALSGSNVYLGASLFIVFEYTDDIGPVTIELARTREVTENSGFFKVAIGS